MTPRAARVLVLSLVFPPEAVSTAQLFGELVEDLLAQGRRVTVITTKPHFHPKAVAEQRRSLRPAWGGLIGRTEYRRAEVLHTAMPVKGTRAWTRVLGWLGFHVLSIAAALRLVGPIDVILAPSPPLTVGVAAWVISLWKRVPYIYNVQELYPDTAVAVGVVREGWLLRLLLRLERFVYGRAFAVTAISAGMRSKIIAKGKSPERVRLIPNFVDASAISERPKANSFALEHGLADRFVVMYAGNMGRVQGLDVLLQSAVLTRDRTDILYVLVGEGVLRDHLVAMATFMELPNVRFIPQQPYDRVPEIYGASDVNVVPLLNTVIADAVPSKVYRIMAACRPILAIADPNSDLAEIVRDAGAGWVVPPDDAETIANVVRRARAGAREMGLRGRAYVLEHVERTRVTSAYGALLDEAAHGHQCAAS